MNFGKKILVAISVATVSAVMFMAAGAMAAGDKGGEAIAERLKAVGKVCMAGDDCAGGAVVVAAGEARSGEELYTTKCFSCHGTGVGGAPKLGDTEAWAPRLEKGMDEVFNNAWNGMGAMPAKGICMDCSEEEIKIAIDYMIKGE
ncbi:cytochrome c5 family protein [Aurantivibrio infirmus]